MNFQKIDNTLLLLAPENFFIDKNNQANSYNETNPSLYINKNGYITILIRLVNYRKFSNKQFTLGQYKSISKYVIMSGTSFNELETKDIEYDWNNFPKYNTYWEGMEDIRFIDENLLLVTVPERNINGQPCIFLAELNDNKIKLLQQLKPNITEKNWMPYNWNSEYKVIYSVSPFCIKSLNNDDKIYISNDCEKELENYHGSTNGINFCDKLLFLVHKYENKTSHRWILFDPDNLTLKISEPFTFYEHSYIEFTCSLVCRNDKIYVSLGINDNKAVIVTLCSDSIKI